MIRALTVSVLIASQSLWVYAQTGMVLCFHTDGQARTEQAGDLCCDSEKSGQQISESADQGPSFIADEGCVCSDFAFSSANPQISPKLDATPVLPTAQLVPSLIEDIATGLVHEPVSVPSDHGPPDTGPLAHLKTVVLRF